MADWQALARNAARQEGIDPSLYVALIRQESGGRQYAKPGVVLRSGAGAIGYSQLMPGTAKGLGVDPLDPQQNLLGGARYLRQQLRTFHGNVSEALAAYNAGPGAVQAAGGVPNIPETRNYVKSILGAVGGKTPGATNGTGQDLASTPAGVQASGPQLDFGSPGSAVALLTALGQQNRTAPSPSSGGLAAPAFAAGPKLPSGYASLASSGGPAARPDISKLLAVAASTAGSGGGVIPGRAQNAAQSDSSAPLAPSGATAGGKGLPKGTVAFEGKPVAAWIAPALAYARKQGWKGTVSSGYRSYAEQKRIYDSGVRPAAAPGTSNHEGDAYPRGAVDVTDAAQLSQILARSPYRDKLIWAGKKDPVHFSHPHNGGY